MSWFELVLVGMFGFASAGLGTVLSDRAHDELAVTAPREDAVQLDYKISDQQSALGALDQEITAIRTQVIASDIEARRRGAEVTSLKARYEGLQKRAATKPVPASTTTQPAPGAATTPPARGASILQPAGSVEPSIGQAAAQLDQSLATVAQALDGAIVGEASSTEFAKRLADLLTSLLADRRRVAKALVAAQRDAATALAALRDAHEGSYRDRFLGFAAPWLAGVTVAAAVIALLLAPTGRRRSAALTVLLGVLWVACIVVGYHLYQIAGVAGAAAAGLILILFAVRIAQ